MSNNGGMTIRIGVVVLSTLGAVGFLKLLTASTSAAQKADATKAAASKSAPKGAAPAAAKPAAKPASVAGAKSKPAASRPTTPLASFPAAVAVPALDRESSAASLQPVVWGPVTFGPESICILHLMNESGALPGGKSFGLEAIAAGDVEREWDFFVRAAGMESGGEQIAKLLLRDQQLRFQWTAAALDEPLAERLANVALKISIGADSKMVALRRPTRIPMVTLATDSTLTPRWELPAAPITSSLRVELRLASREPRYRFVGPAILSQKEPTTWIEFGIRSKDDQGLKMKLTADFRQGVGLKIEPFFQLNAQAKVLPLSDASLKRAETESEQMVTQLKARLAQLGAIAGGGKGDKNKSGKGGKSAAQNSPAALLRRQLESQLKLAENARSQVGEIRSLMKTVDGKSKLHVRVYHEVESYPFDLLTPKP